MSKPIVITTTEKGEFKSETKILARSGFIKGLLDQFTDESQFEIPNISNRVMTLIVEWLEKHKDTEPRNPPQPLRNYDLQEVVGKWEGDFMDRVFNNSFDSLFEFLNAVNFLDIPALLELGSAKTACLIKDFSPEEFKKLFKIEEDCSTDDVKKIEEEVLKEREEEREKERSRLEKAEKEKEVEPDSNKP